MNSLEEKNTLDMVLSEDDRVKIDEIVSGIDLDSAEMILQYGASCQQKIDTFSASMLDNIREKDLGKPGKLIGELVEELKRISSGGRRKRMEQVESKVDVLTAMLYDSQNMLLEESIRLKRFYKENMNYYKELTLHIIAGQKKLESVSGGQLRDNFEKKIQNLEVSRLICVQMAAQLDILRSNNVAVSDNIQAVLKNTIPLWRNRISTAEGIDAAGENNKQLILALDEILRIQKERSECV